MSGTNPGLNPWLSKLSCIPRDFGRSLKHHDLVVNPAIGGTLPIELSGNKRPLASMGLRGQKIILDYSRSHVNPEISIELIKVLQTQ